MVDPGCSQTGPLECPENCPGCGHKRMFPGARLLQKEAWLNQKLRLWKTRMAPIQTAPEDLQWRYRGKACLSTRWAPEGWRFGLIRRDTVIPIHDCPIHTPAVRQAIALFSTALPPSTGFPLVYYAHSGSLVTLVVKSAETPTLTWLDDGFKNRLEMIGIQGLWLHLHPAAGKKVFAKNVWRLLWGAPKALDADGFVYGPRSFQQLIPQLYHQAMDSAAAFLDPAPDDCMVDLYCGSGIGLARWRRQCDHVMGIELDGEAVSNARTNAPGAMVLRGACRERIPQLREWTDMQPPARKRLIYVNPPRTGLEPEVLQWIVTGYRPSRMAYLSCSAGTLHRNLTGLEAAGYRLDRIIPFDFFPNTPHVETLALLKSPEDMP